MMDKLPAKRPSAVEILQDPYIKRHMEVKSYTPAVTLYISCIQALSHKLTLTLMPTKSNPSEEAKAIAHAL